MLIGILVIIFSCKSKHQIISYPVPDALKKACLFQKGSYWVYLNDSTHLTDSVYLISDPVQGSFNDDFNNIVYYYSTLLKSGFLSGYSISGEFVNSTSNGCPFLITTYYDIGYCDSSFPAFILYDDTLTNHKGTTSYQCGDFKDAVHDNAQFTELGSFSTYKINNLIFNRVLITRSVKQMHFYPSDSDTLDFYFSPGIGLINYIFRGDIVPGSIYSRTIINWSLLRYHIVQQN